MPEELLVAHLRVIELLVVVDGDVKELAVRWIELVIVLAESHIEVADPAELAVHIPVLRQARVFGHPSAFDFIFFVRVEPALWRQHGGLPRREVFVEELLKKNEKESKDEDTHKKLLGHLVRAGH